jgi:adenylate cyclase
MIDTPDPQQNFDARAGRRIVDIHVWAVREGLRGTEPAMLFMGLCQRLVDASVPVWRAFAATRTLHPQWAGYSYTWWRDGGDIEPAQFPRGDHYEQIVADSVFGYLRRKSAVVGNGEPSISLRRRLAGPEVRLDFPVLAELAAHGATDYIAELVGPGVEDASRCDAV